MAELKEAMFYKKKDSLVECGLCWRKCKIPDNGFGFCGVRKNVKGKLYAMTYGRPCSYNVDPIEKKPFYHFWPGSLTFSIATVGCNFRCLHCQNADISQAKPGGQFESELPPAEVVRLAGNYCTAGISYTYTEPTIFFEYCYDTGILAHKKKMYNTFVTNGYYTPEALEKAKDFLDAARIDLKGDEKHYEKVVGGAKLEHVLDSIKRTYKAGIHVEVITLVIPGDNDSKQFVDRMADFLKSLSPEIPWHFTQFFPTYKMLDRPRTPAETLEKMHKWASDAGMKYVYVGNVAGHELENTYCPNCRELLIQRNGFDVVSIFMAKDKKCPGCGAKIPIIGEF